MAYVKDFLLPPTGEPIDAARLVAWAVRPGQSFRAGDTLFEVETDKSVMEIPAAEDGKLLEQLVAADGVLDSDTPVARIEVEGDAAIEEDAAVQTEAPVPEKRTMATPSARRISRELGIAVLDVPGTGPRGRVTQADVLRMQGGLTQPGSYSVTRPTTRKPGAGNRLVSTSHGDIHISSWSPPAPRAVPAVVLIHGIFGDIDTWAGTVSALTRAGIGGFALDLPCHGKSPSDAADFAAIVDAAAQAILAVADGPVALVGHSFGAAVAARIAAMPASNVTSLSLIAPLGLGTEIESTFLNGMAQSRTNEALARELRKLTQASMPLSQAYLDELRGRLRDRSGQLTRLCEDFGGGGVQQISILPDLLKAGCPVMLIQGRLDAIIPWLHVLNAPPRVALHLIPDVGHMPQWESASLVNELIQNAVVRSVE